jgi:hypothetical protein
MWCLIVVSVLRILKHKNGFPVGGHIEKPFVETPMWRMQQIHAEEKMLALLTSPAVSDHEKLCMARLVQAEMPAVWNKSGVWNKIK